MRNVTFSEGDLVSIATLLMRLGAPSFSLELAQHVRLCGKDKDAVEHARMILGVSESQSAPARDGAATATVSGAAAAKDPAKLAFVPLKLSFGLPTPPALFGATDIRERNKEGKWALWM